MNWRRGLFRLWIVGSVLFVLAVAFVSYSDIKAQFDDTKRLFEDLERLPVFCGDARGVAGTDYTTRKGQDPGPWDTYAKPDPMTIAGIRCDPPPLKWSDLRYVFDIKEDCNGKEAIQARRDRREAAPGGCSGLAGARHDGGDPPDRGERGDLLSLASRVWRAEDRAGQAPEGA